MFKKLIDAVRHKDDAADPVTRQMSQAKQENEVARARAEEALCTVLDKPGEACVGGLRIEAVPERR